MKCTYASTCKARMAHGDMPNGCDDRDEAKCLYAIWLDEVYMHEDIQKVPDHMLFDIACK